MSRLKSLESLFYLPDSLHLCLRRLLWATGESPANRFGNLWLKRPGVGRIEDARLPPFGRERHSIGRLVGYDRPENRVPNTDPKVA